ncbi:MAG: hypothetical protein HYX93_03805, partial [Chloroflexi bacterium]|nr:hypothetical protein [Chloroflexota bacterium]
MASVLTEATGGTPAAGTWEDGATATTAATALAATIDFLAGVGATSAAGVVTITADAFGAGGNDILVSSDDADLAVSTATLTGGAAGVKASATVTITNTGTEVAGKAVTVTVPSAARIRSTGVKASGVFTVVDGDNTTNYTITVGSTVLTATADFVLDTVDATTATNLRTKIGTLSGFAATGAGTTVIVESTTAGRAGNSIAIASSNPNAVTASAATLSGGVDSSLNFLFTATAPSLAGSTHTWNVTSTDVGANGVIGGGDDTALLKSPITTVDNTVPVVQTITTTDSDTDGNVDVATVVFNDNMDASTCVPANWTIGGKAATNCDAGGNATELIVRIVGLSASQVPGTAAADVTYTPGAL